MIRLALARSNRCVSYAPRMRFYASAGEETPVVEAVEQEDLEEASTITVSERVDDRVHSYEGEEAMISIDLRPIERIPMVPAPRSPFDSVSSLLIAIDPSFDKYVDKFESWEQLFQTRSRKLKAMGMQKGQERKKLLNWLEKYRQGVDPHTCKNNLYYNRWKS